jgi:mannose-6-phosphate isomerase-like protein (cupin superfamily)
MARRWKKRSCVLQLRGTTPTSTDLYALMNAKELITSGLLEEYVLGTLDAEQVVAVRNAIATESSVQTEVLALEQAFEQLAMAQATEPPLSARSEILSLVNAAEVEHANTERPPILHPASKAAEFARWIEQPHLVEDPANEDTYFMPFAMNEEALTALVWMRKGAPVETHTDCIEKFLILEGTCNIIIGDKAHPMRAGDYMRIPMHVPHSVVVTSDITCRIIVQRVAA